MRCPLRADGVTVAAVRVLIAPDSFGGTLSAGEAAEAIAAGWRRAASGSGIVTVPLSDGGPGFLDVIQVGLEARGIRSQTLMVTVLGPLGQPVPATIVMHEQTAYIESAQSCGLHLVRVDDRDPLAASSAGLGITLDHARAAGAERVVVGLGGTATVDAGAGLLAALAATAWDADGRDDVDALRHGPAALERIAKVDISPAIRDWAEIDLIAAVDVDVPLMGPAGAARGFAAQKFPDPASVSTDDLARLEGIHARFADLVHGDLDTAELTGHPGSGAAGGIGWALQCLGAAVVPGFDIVAASVGLADRLDGIDLVITGEGRLDWQSRRGKVIAGVAELASARGIPVVAVAGRVDLGARESAALGIVETWSLAEQPGGLARSMTSPHEALTAAAARIAGQWAGRAG